VLVVGSPSVQPCQTVDVTAPLGRSASPGRQVGAFRRSSGSRARDGEGEAASAGDATAVRRHAAAAAVFLTGSVIANKVSEDEVVNLVFACLCFQRGEHFVPVSCRQPEMQPPPVRPLARPGRGRLGGALVGAALVRWLLHRRGQQHPRRRYPTLGAGTTMSLIGGLLGVSMEDLPTGPSKFEVDKCRH